MSNFLEQIRRKQEAAKAGPQSKPISEMSEAELDREATRLQGEVRRLRENEIAAQREVVESGGRSRFLPNKRRRPTWR